MLKVDLFMNWDFQLIKLSWITIFHHRNYEGTLGSWVFYTSASWESVTPASKHFFLEGATRFAAARGLGYNKQLYGHNVEVSHHQAIFNRSIFAMVDIYNNLPQYVVDAPSVSAFQKYLNQIA